MIGRGISIINSKIAKNEIFGLIVAFIGILFFVCGLKIQNHDIGGYLIYYAINFILLGILISFTGKNKLKSLLDGKNIPDKIAGISIILYSIISVTIMVEAISKPHGATDLDWIVVVFIILGFFYFIIGSAILLSLHRLTVVLSLAPFIVSVPFWGTFMIFAFDSSFTIFFFPLCLIPTIIFIYSFIKWWLHRKINRLGLKQDA
ncbi:MAG: hypothetical protein PHU53_02070 [Thermoplasmata archaeon]|nr:hypothetical protein [Thermoplasmata archaeon]